MNIRKKILASVLTFVLIVTSAMGVTYNEPKEVKAEALGNLANKVTGTWSYWDGNKDVVQTNAMLLDKLPTLANKGTYRFTTDNYDASSGALDIGGWSTSMAWNYSSNAFGNAVYAVPLSYVAKTTGMYVTKPSTSFFEDPVSSQNTMTMFMMQPEDGSLTDFLVGTDYTFASSKLDKETEWATDIVMENTNNVNQYMKVTMVQGSPFGFFQLNGSKTMTVKRNRSLPSDIVSYNGTTLANSTMIVVRVFDNADLVAGYGDYDYYAIYVPEGTTWNQASATASYADNRMGHLTATFPSESDAYLSIAYLCETNGQNDSVAIAMANEYEKYAYNFVTGTETSFNYDRSTGKITTTYTYTLDKKKESAADGTLMGILPHQYKNMSGYEYSNYTIRSIRGTIKYLVGTSYKTTLTYSGILPSMPGVEEADKIQLQEYIDAFMDEYGPTETAVTKEDYNVNTYDSGKKLNRAIQVMEAAEACGDTESATALLNGIKAELADWFTSTGTEEDKYFYYYDEVGSLFGFPQAYYTVDGMTDHHFHYGYFIQAAAQVALRDPSFIEQHGNIVEELIGDIATYERTNADSKYPFLRYFSTYEGHSWASGHANFGDGNNQESSSEALNAWAALVLWGQATGDEDLTDLGIYLYQTEISAVNNYWFDVDGDILDAKFTKKSSADSSLREYNGAAMVWGGKYTYATWWTAEPLQIQGINLLPLTSASLYLAANTDYVKANWKTANLKEAGFTGGDKDSKRWNELWSGYLAIADPEAALEYFDDSCAPEAGDSKAHAYHYIMALDKAGTPNLKISANSPLATTFIDENDVITYVAYNAGDSDKVVKFTDGTEMTVKPGELASKTDGEVAGKAQYTIKHYLQNSTGTYDLFQTETKSAKIDAEVTAVGKSYEGYALNTTVEGTVLSGIVTEENTLELTLYYDITEVETTLPSADISEYSSLGQYNGYDIMYNILKDDFGIANIQLLDGNRTFYVVYSGDYNATNTKGYLNQQEKQGNILGGVYNLQLTAVQPDSWNTIKAVSGNKQIYIVVRYGNPSGSPDLSDYDGEIETANPNLPSEVSGLVVGSPSENKIMVTFRETEEQNEKGQLYNIYIDDQLVENGVDVGTYTFTDISRGRHTVKVTAVLNNVESDGVSSSVSVTGESITTEPTEPTTTTTQEPSSDDPIDPETSTSGEKPSDDPIDPETSTSGEKPSDDPIDPETSTPGEVPSSEEPSTPSESTTVEPSTQVPTTTIVEEETTDDGRNMNRPGKVVVKKAKKKLKAKTASIKLKKVEGASGYEVAIYKNKKKAKKNNTNKAIAKADKAKVKIIVKSKKLKNKKKLYVRVRAYVINNSGMKVHGKWSKVKKVNIKK